MEHVIRITWVQQDREAMHYGVECADADAAWRVFRRLCDVGRALISEEARRQEGRP
jgi:hypothetical protein